MSKLTVRSRLKADKLWRFFVLCCAFLAAVNFIDRFYYFIYAAFALFLFIPRLKIRMNYSTVHLLVLGASMLIFNPDTQDSITDMIRPFTFVMVYIMGMSLYDKDDPMEQKETHIKKLLWILAGGALLHYFLNMITNYGSIVRNTVDFWTGSVLSATNQACLACMCVGVIAALMFSPSGKWYKLMAAAVMVVIISYNFVLAGRTLIYLFVVMFAVAFLYQIYNYRRQSFRTILIWVLIIATAVILFNMDAFGIKSSFEDSNFYYRFWAGDRDKDAFESGRLDRKLLFLQNMIRYPFGGSYIRNTYHQYAHDLYLDTYDLAGVFALVGIGAYVICSVLRLFRLLKRTDVSFATRQLLLCVYVVVNIEFWIEPIMLASPWLLASYCMIDGMVAYMLLPSKNDKKGILSHEDRAD